MFVSWFRRILSDGVPVVCHRFFACFFSLTVAFISREQFVLSILLTISCLLFHSVCWIFTMNCSTSFPCCSGVFHSASFGWHSLFKMVSLEVRVIKEWFEKSSKPSFIWMYLTDTFSTMKKSKGLGYLNYICWPTDQRAGRDDFAYTLFHRT